MKRVGRGVFKLGESESFTPTVSKSLKSLYKRIKGEFPYVDLCVWNTSFLSNLMLHQPFNFITLLETDRDVTESVFQYLKGSKKNVFLNPSKGVIQDYVQGSNDAIIVKPLISESPLQEIKKVKTATIEKILVDLICDTDLYVAYQGVERKHIFEEAFSQYTINEKTMLRYADRRKRKNELIQYLDKLNLLVLNK